MVVPEWMKENFARGQYPNLSQRPKTLPSTVGLPESVNLGAALTGVHCTVQKALCGAGV